MKLPTPKRWAALWRHWASKGFANLVFEELVSLYSQPHRHYHNLQHIEECLVEFDAVRELAQNPIAVELAIWFHDAVYDTHAPDNEERSAELASDRVRAAGGKGELGKAVANLVLATKTHAPAQRDDASLVVDIDLAIYGKATDRFVEYEAQIRREYAWVPAALFAAKRSEILERFLRRDRLYTTDKLHEKYEMQARINLQSSVRNLKTLGMNLAQDFPGRTHNKGDAAG